MIAKSAQHKNGCFPIGVYRDELEAEGLDVEKTLAFIEATAPHCIYINTH
jgi:hypothetical protein